MERRLWLGYCFIAGIYSQNFFFLVHDHWILNSRSLVLSTWLFEACTRSYPVMLISFSPASHVIQAKRNFSRIIMVWLVFVSFHISEGSEDPEFSNGRFYFHPHNCPKPCAYVSKLLSSLPLCKHSHKEKHRKMQGCSEISQEKKEQNIQIYVQPQLTLLITLKDMTRLFGHLIIFAPFPFFFHLRFSAERLNHRTSKCWNE